MVWVSCDGLVVQIFKRALSSRERNEKSRLCGSEFIQHFSLRINVAVSFLSLIWVKISRRKNRFCFSCVCEAATERETLARCLLKIKSHFSSFAIHWQKMSWKKMLKRAENQWNHYVQFSLWRAFLSVSCNINAVVAVLKIKLLHF